MTLPPFDEFETVEVLAGETTIFLRRFGSGRPVLLLHGFPQTHLMWRSVAPLLSRSFTVICADLPGYGRSGIPVSRPDHAQASKRAMAAALIAMMEKLGFSRFSVAGHDRGGRVAYRMALDHPDVIERLAVLDVIPIAEAWKRADKRLTIGYWPWSLLAQPEPLPEKLLSAAPEAVISDALSNWGSASEAFGPEIHRAYVEQLRDPARVHAICEEYRAGATIDHEHDLSDQTGGRRIVCPVLVLWSKQGGLNDWYSDAGGPLGLWRDWAHDVRGAALPGGHFFAEEIPQQTADELINFFAPP